MVSCCGAGMGGGVEGTDWGVEGAELCWSHGGVQRFERRQWSPCHSQSAAAVPGLADPDDSRRWADFGGLTLYMCGNISTVCSANR